MESYGFLILILILAGLGLVGFGFILIRIFVAPRNISRLVNLIQQERTDPAINLAKQIISRDPGNSEAYFLLGKCYLTKELPELAFAEFQEVNRLGSFSSHCPELEFRQIMAGLYFKFGNWEEALTEYILLIKKDPAQASHYIHAGGTPGEERQNR